MHFTAHKSGGIIGVQVEYDYTPIKPMPPDSDKVLKMLTETALKNLKPKEKPYKVADQGGLYIQVSSTGGKHWRLKYRFNGKEKSYTIGTYPIISIKLAREKALEAKQLLAQNIDPSAAKQLAKLERAAQEEEQKEVETKQAFTFEKAFFDWHDFKQSDWTPKHAQAIAGRYRLWLAPSFATKRLDSITPADCVAVIKRIEDAGKFESRDKVRALIGQIMRFMVSSGKLASDPSRDLSGDIFKKAPKKNFAHQTDPKAIRAIYRTICAPYGGYVSTHAAMKLLALTFLRVTELAGLKWNEIDFENRVIRIEAGRMKMKREHITPLSTQALALLMDQHEHHSGGDFVFPSTLTPKRHLTIEAILAGMRRQGIGQDEFSNHGWRHAASTTLHELGYTPQAIESQLSHIVTGVAGVYNKALHLEERTGMMQAWADWLEGLKG